MANENLKEYRYKYPNESFSGCDMIATIVYGWENEKNEEQESPTVEIGKDSPIVGKSIDSDSIKAKSLNSNDISSDVKRWNARVLGEIQTISYSIHMEKRPVRSIGNVNAKDYVMGPRTIAGSLVFAVFNKHFAKDIIADHNDYFKEGTAFVVDELPPFNIVISMANEYGLRSKMVIYGVRLVNEGQVMSVNDVYTENTYQFVATDIEYLNDEVTYASRPKDSYWIKIQDYVSQKDTDLYNSVNGKVEVNYHDPNAKGIEKITMNISTVDATSLNADGMANISLYPIQTEGTITIKDSNTNYTEDNPAPTIKMNGSRTYSISLPPELYTASFDKPNPGKWQCQSKTFLISKANDKYDKKKYAPIIEKITDKSLKVYANEPTHTHVVISDKDGENEVFHKLKNRRIEIKDLTADTEYFIATCTGEDTLTSPYIKVKTFKVFEKPFNDFKKMVETNRQLLLYNELDRYYKIINEAESMAIKNNNFESPTNLIVDIKRDAEKELSGLDPEMDGYQDAYNEITYKIYACNELIYLSNKVQNNLLSIVNKDVEIKAPELIYNKSYDAIFKFEENIEKAEFFRVIRGMAQSSDTVYANSFTDVDGNKNSVKYKGRSGTNHYVQSLIGNSRSPKLEYYEMTVTEKQLKINSDENRQALSESDISKIKSIVKEQLDSNATDIVINRAMMSKTKNVQEPLILPPNVIKKENDYIELTTKIKDIAYDKDVEFYISVAKLDDIINNDYIYKHKFTCEDETIVLNDIDYALHNGQYYALWIEDKEFNQISNVTTFKMEEEEDVSDKEVLEYELSDIIEDIKNKLSSTLPNTIYETLCSYIEYNDDINKDNIIDRTIEYLLYSGLGKTHLRNSLKAINNYIGTIVDSDDIIKDVEYNNNQLSYSCDKNVQSIIVSYKQEDVSYNKIDSTLINTNLIDAEYMFIFGITADLKFKTKIIFIDKNSNEMEVL